MAALLVIFSLAGCASTDVPPMGYQGRPFQPDADERQLWSDAAREEDKLAKLVTRWDDPPLEEYLLSLATKLVPREAREAAAPAARIVVVKDPTLNAFAMPDGTVYVHTGLLSRLQSESQLAMVLGRELTHVTNRHALKLSRDARGAHIFRARATSHVYLSLGLPLAYTAAVTGFGRDLEREADREGLERMAAAAYDPAEAPRAFELLKDDHGDDHRLESFFLGDRGHLDERIASAREFLKARPPGPSAVAGDAEGFARRLRTLVRENAALDIRTGRFGLAKAQLDRILPLAPRDPTTQLYLGDLYRLQAQRAETTSDESRLLARAREAYEGAAQLDATFPDPLRQLGLLYYQSHDLVKAAAAFRAYLALKPDAPDARRIKEYVIELER